jgi:hypothetical protein
MREVAFITSPWNTIAPAAAGLARDHFARMQRRAQLRHRAEVALELRRRARERRLDGE